MGALGSLIFDLLHMGCEYGFKKLKTRKATLIRFVVLGALCGFNLFATIYFVCTATELWWMGLMTFGAIFGAFVWRFIWDGVLLVKNNFEAPPKKPPAK